MTPINQYQQRLKYGGTNHLADTGERGWSRDGYELSCKIMGGLVFVASRVWRVDLVNGQLMVGSNEYMLMGEDGAIRWRTWPDILISAASIESSPALMDDIFRPLQSIAVACSTARATVWPVLIRVVKRSPRTKRDTPTSTSSDSSFVFFWNSIVYARTRSRRSLHLRTKSEQKWLVKAMLCGTCCLQTRSSLRLLPLEALQEQEVRPEYRLSSRQLLLRVRPHNFRRRHLQLGHVYSGQGIQKWSVRKDRGLWRCLGKFHRKRAAAYQRSCDWKLRWSQQLRDVISKQIRHGSDLKTRSILGHSC